MLPLAKLNSSAVAAIAWWIVPLLGVSGAIIYVIWVSKFKEKYENETNRSVEISALFKALFAKIKIENN